MNSSVYLYNEINNSYEVYLGECSILEGLLLLSNNQKIIITHFGATLYKNYSWATETELPLLETIGDVVAFIKAEEEMGIIDFEATLPNLGKFSSHDDRECIFQFESKQACIAILKLAIPSKYSGMLINQLINNKGLYLSCDSAGVVNKYSSFKGYLNRFIN